MNTTDGKPIGEVPQKKDPYWWMHPAYRGEQTLDMDTLKAMPAGGYKWTNFSGEDASDSTLDDLAQAVPGHFGEFAELLYKVNGYRRGPVANWYVIVCVEAEKRWAVGQLRADAVTPVQVFDDLIFDSEAAARECAESLRHTE